MILRPYSASKASSDHLVRAARNYGLPIILTNCSNNYGPYHFLKTDPDNSRNALAGQALPFMVMAKIYVIGYMLKITRMHYCWPLKKEPSAAVIISEVKQSELISNWLKQCVPF